MERSDLCADKKGSRKNQHVSERVSKLLLAKDIDGLRKLSEKAGQNLSEKLDEVNLFLLSMAKPEVLKAVEDAFPGIISRIPYPAAVLSGNTFVLEANRDRYSKQCDKCVTAADRSVFMKNIRRKYPPCATPRSASAWSPPTSAPAWPPPSAPTATHCTR